ncbi:hypothetical protein ABIE38_003496 [Dietzia sp. 2505]
MAVLPLTGTSLPILESWLDSRVANLKSTSVRAIGFGFDGHSADGASKFCRRLLEYARSGQPRP